MLTFRTSGTCTILLLCLIVSASCAASPTLDAQKATATPTSSPTVRVAQPTPTPTPTSITATPTRGTTPQQYTSHIFSHGVGRPDDMVFDRQGRVLFSDFYNGTINRLNSDGSVTTLLRGLAGPEGLIVLSDGSMIIAEQSINRILTLAPGATVPTVLRTLPSTPSASNCDKHGVDGIAFDATTNTLIVPDSPTGNVYRMSLDGKKLTLLASNIPRPVGAAVDAQGNIYVADECGGALFRISPAGTITRTGGFGMLDDIALDPRGNILITDLLPSIHALIRIDAATGKRQTLASRGFIEPQGLLVGSNDTIYMSDDYADIIVEYVPV